MKFTLDWLKDHLETEKDLDTIVDTLTNIGLEIESVEDKSKTFNDFTVAEVIKAEQHPDADRLRVCSVKTIDGVFQVVCGAPNARTGMKGIFAPENSFIPGTGIRLKKSKIRGVESCGMLVSEKEMDISDEHNGIIEVEAKYNLGDKFIDVFNLNDPVIEINITPNRGDCLSVRGIARDLAAAGLGKLKENTLINNIAGTFESLVKWEKDFKGDEEYICPGVAGRYFKNVVNKESPLWLQQRLKAIGLRPISALVDITNYITYDLGRPLHVYDADKIKGNLKMRFAKEKETCLTLDEAKYECRTDMIVIADNDKLHGIGGVMGGLDSGCSLDTKNVFLEVALFDPISVTKAGRYLKLQSDARYRFERGIDSSSIDWGVQAATKMIIDLCGGEVSKTVQTNILNTNVKQINFNTDKVTSLGGVEISIKEQKNILESLGFAVQEQNNILIITPPSFRPDIHDEADIVEEILRIYGFDKIPLTDIQDKDSKKNILNSNLKSFYKIKRVIANQGYLEAVTWSFMDKQVAKLVSDNVIEIKNPISSDLNVMRPSNVPNLLHAINLNKSKMINRGKLFEVGPIFSESLEDRQTNVATGISYGNISEGNWNSNSKDIDVFDIKADLMRILDSLNTPINNLNYEKIENKIFHPGKSSSLRIGKNIIANFGELNPILLKSMNIQNPVMAFEVFTDALGQFQIKKTSTIAAFDNNPFQMVERDFAFLFPNSVKADEIISKIKKIDKKLINKVSIFDVYEGDKIAKDTKSIAIRVLLQPLEKTFNDEEIESLSTQIIDVITINFKATLRK
ncbi:MAG: phenylalanine--tRNA ligase subunit beta [Pelagibacteraceae bacterium]|nr:phenylalanine--tRNA ligase subunit beta [Pelagibacteraceae bacterium]